MATETTNLGLTKPAGSDAALIASINANMDTLDEAIGDTDTLTTTSKEIVGAINEIVTSEDYGVIT